MDQSPVTLEWMRSFVRVAERGSFSAAARELGLGQSTVTRHLRDLEGAVGVALLSRTTRRVTVTEEGRRYYRHSLEILRRVEQAREEARGTGAAPSGTIRISCTAALGVRAVSGIVFAFLDAYPGIEIDLGLTDERVDLVREGIDLALRLGPLTDSTLKVRTLGWSRRLLVAAPAYLAAHGRPLVPEHLATHAAVRMSNVAGSDSLPLEGPDGQRHTVRVGGRLRLDHGLAAREALIAGRGIGAAHHWLIDDCLADGRLEAILTDYALPSVPLSLLLVPERAAIGRVRLFIEFLVARIGAVPGFAAPRPSPHGPPPP
ncbi:LysR family transcriptional regulator [Methylorubrum populi]|nr:LysR family transcriptional regulator [Methylorubrum populi]